MLLTSLPKKHDTGIVKYDIRNRGELYMAKVKKSNKTKKITKTAKVAASKVNNRLSVLLLILAFLVFALAAIAMNDSSKSQMVPSPSPVKVVATPTAKPVVKTVKTTVKK